MAQKYFMTVVGKMYSAWLTARGALLEPVGTARSVDAGDTLALRKRRGRRSFDMDVERSSADA